MGRHKVILDCDNSFGRFGCDIDDALALLYLLGRDDVDLVGVTTVFGNTRLDHVVRITNALLNRLGYSAIPVLRGAAGAGDGQTEAARFLARSAVHYSGELSVVATGPLTNLAGAAATDHSFFENLKSLTCMDGYHQPIRIGLRPAGEINISADPDAARQVFQRARPTRLFTTEVCLQASIGLGDLWRLSWLDIAIRRQMMGWLTSYGLSRGIMHFYLWDVLPAIAVTHPHLFDQHRCRAPARITDLETGYITDEAGDEIDMPTRITDLAVFKSAIHTAWAGAAPASRRHLKVNNEIDVGAPIDNVFAVGDGSLVTSANN